ncbi:MAG: hypothetical protein Q9163_004325 [Psora crenata]
MIPPAHQVHYVVVEWLLGPVKDIAALSGLQLRVMMRSLRSSTVSQRENMFAKRLKKRFGKQNNKRKRTRNQFAPPSSLVDEVAEETRKNHDAKCLLTLPIEIRNMAEFANLTGIFGTCKQLRGEAFEAFNRVNTFNLERATFNKNPYLSSPMPSRPSIPDASYLTQNNKHFFLGIDTSPGGVFELPVPLPADVDKTSRAAIREWIRTQHMSGRLQQCRNVSEYDMCKEFAKSLGNLAKSQASGLSYPRSLKLQIVLHEPHWQRRVVHQCGLTLHVDVKFCSSQTPPSTMAARGLITQAARTSANLPPKTRLLLPLLDMHNVQRIDVRRTWTLKVRKKEANTVTSVVAKSADTPQMQMVAMALRFRYRTAQELLVAAGKDLVNFRIMGLAEAGVNRNELIEIAENTPGDKNAILVPQKPTETSHCYLKSLNEETRTA